MLFCHVECEIVKHPKLRDEKGLTGLPSVAFLDAAGRVLVSVPFKARSVGGFRHHGERAHRYVALRSASEAGDREAGARFLLMQLEERQVRLAAAEARRVALGELDDEALDREFVARLVDLKVGDALQSGRRAGDPRSALGPGFLSMHRDGPRPSPHVSRGFWFAILEWAESEDDAEVFAEALGGMRRALAITDPEATWVPRLLADYERKLGELRREPTDRSP